MADIPFGKFEVPPRLEVEYTLYISHLEDSTIQHMMGPWLRDVQVADGRIGDFAHVQNLFWCFYAEMIVQSRQELAVLTFFLSNRSLEYNPDATWRLHVFQVLF